MKQSAAIQGKGMPPIGNKGWSSAAPAPQNLLEKATTTSNTAIRASSFSIKCMSWSLACEENTLHPSLQIPHPPSGVKAASLPMQKIRTLQVSHRNAANPPATEEKNGQPNYGLTLTSQMREKMVKPPLPKPNGRHIASTPEGCDISRDNELGFVVACGDDGKGQRHVPTLSAAYAICQQLMPRQPN